jgi:photosystem II stability/assembly factor-like uncharacterized protein
MMKKIFLFLFIVFNINLSYSQWNVINVGNTQDLYSVDYYTLNDAWIGTLNQFVKTTDGGVSWNTIPLVDNSSVSITPSAIYDIALNSPTNAISTGMFALGNIEYILNTTNGGSNWNYASTNTTTTLPRYLNAIDISGSRAVAVGSHGRIAISSNSGASWTFSTSGITDVIRDVKFVSYDTVIAVADYRILKSFDGGSTWTFNSYGGGLFKNIYCDHNTIYISKPPTNDLWKSTDYGATYTTIHLPFSYQGVFYALNKDTLVVAGDNGLFVSNSAGQYWEQYILPSYNTIRMFDFFDVNKGIAVGNTGFALKTDNLSLAPKIPVSVFSITGGGNSFCQGDSISFTNATVPGYTYQWKINGANFSTQYNPGWY